MHPRSHLLNDRIGEVDEYLRKIVSDFLKNYLQFSFVLVLGRVSLVFFEQGSPDMEIQWIKVGRIRSHSSFLMQSGLTCSSQPCASRDV